MAEPGKLWVGSIVVECKEFQKMMEFWMAALGYETRRASLEVDEDFVVLHDPQRKGPNISLQKVSEGPDRDYRFHFDLYSSDLEAEVQRLLKLGARMREPAQPGRDFVTLADPDGNPFDIVEARGFAFGQCTD
jgi:Glyoxalase-like domain